jgi:hypothetical protein
MSLNMWNLFFRLNFPDSAQDSQKLLEVKKGQPEISGEFLTLASDWCGRGDSNPHALRRHPLKMVRLPVPPLPHGVR